LWSAPWRRPEARMRNGTAVVAAAATAVEAAGIPGAAAVLGAEVVATAEVAALAAAAMARRRVSLLPVRNADPHR